ncbi:hypothetical protein JCM1840_006206 [Sporobolomyces johnsonii]
MLAVRLRTATPPLVRLASTARPSPAPKKAPHDKIPFTAPPVDTTKGKLAQVYLPDMAPLEQVRTVAIKIPSAPDTYSTSSSTDSSDDFPTLHASPKIITASHPSTYPSGGPSANALGDDVQLGEAGDSRSALPKEHDRSQDGYEGRPLNAEEKRGLWKLAGIVGAGWGLSWATDPTRKKKD